MIIFLGFYVIFYEHMNYIFIFQEDSWFMQIPSMGNGTDHLDIGMFAKKFGRSLISLYKSKIMVLSRAVPLFYKS